MNPPSTPLQEPALPTVALRSGRRELEVLASPPRVLERLRAAGATEREPGVWVLPRRALGVSTLPRSVPCNC